MSSNLHPDIARGMVVPNEKSGKDGAKRTRAGEERVDNETESSEDILERAAERNDRRESKAD